MKVVKSEKVFDNKLLFEKGVFEKLMEFLKARPYMDSSKISPEGCFQTALAVFVASVNAFVGQFSDPEDQPWVNSVLGMTHIKALEAVCKKCVRDVQAAGKAESQKNDGQEGSDKEQAEAKFL